MYHVRMNPSKSSVKRITTTMHSSHPIFLFAQHVHPAASIASEWEWMGRGRVGQEIG
jgi:hypothetical protein